MIKLLDHGYVKLIPNGCWGSDEIIIESARMSTNKGFQGWGTDECLEFQLGGYINPDEAPKCEKGSSQCITKHTGDEKLLRYLYEHKHMTPFEMAGLTIEVQAPIMVFREWHRHRTQSYNEMSGRYTELPNLYYLPDADRLMTGKQSTTNKQGSGGQFTNDELMPIQAAYAAAIASSRMSYEEMLRLGVAREIARLVLPVSQYSRMRASANLRNWLAFLSLRLDPAAQWEIRQYASAVETFIKELFPRTHGLFNEAHT
jgi:thymidylate synthase (FAD)